MIYKDIDVFMDPDIIKESSFSLEIILNEDYKRRVIWIPDIHNDKISKSDVDNLVDKIKECMTNNKSVIELDGYYVINPRYITRLIIHDNRKTVSQ